LARRARDTRLPIRGRTPSLSGNPLDLPAGNDLTKPDTPTRTDEQLAYALQRIKDLNAFDSGDAARLGAGVMTDARWKQTYEFMVAAKLLKPETDWKKAYTTQFVRDLKVGAAN